jgi:hypothetical protein
MLSFTKGFQLAFNILNPIVSTRQCLGAKAHNFNIIGETAAILLHVSIIDTSSIAGHDIAYFSAQSCDGDLRGEIELQELRRYHETLIDCGVRDYSFDECLRDYRLNLMITMITPIAVCGTLDPGNERGMELGRVMLQRSLAALESMSCHELLN